MGINVVWLLVMVSVVMFVIMLIDDRRMRLKREERCKKWREVYRLEKVKWEYRGWSGEFNNDYIRSLKERKKGLIKDLMGWNDDKYDCYKWNK